MNVNVLVLVVLLFGYSEPKREENHAPQEQSEFQSIVTLHRISGDKKFQPFCSGIAIHKKLVLTAAHCVTNSYGDLKVTGIYVLHKGVGSNDIISQRVSTGVTHWKDKRNLLMFDIAIITINSWFPENVKQAVVGGGDRLLEEGQLGCEIVKWDIRVSNDSKEHTKIFQETDEIGVTRSRYNCSSGCSYIRIPVKTIDIFDCSDTLSKNNYSLEADGTQFCVKADSMNYCGELSGAPVMCSGFLYGIFSYGDICDKATPSVITRVPYFKYWIAPAITYLRQKIIDLTKVMKKIPKSEALKNDPGAEMDTKIVALFRFSDGQFRPICGGGIVNRRTILTAAHCLVDYKGDEETENVLIMSNYKKIHFTQVDEHAEVAIHPDFNWETRSNDIALVKIEGEFHKDVSPVLLALDDDVTSDLKRFSDCRVFGWGFRDYKTMEKSFKYDFKSSNTSFSITMDKTGCLKKCKLHEVVVRPFPVTRCHEILNLMGDLRTDGSQFCTFGGIYDTCLGDSGDLVFCNKNKVYGVISNGLICGNRHRPIISTRIGYYKKWIIDTMQELENNT